MKESFFLVDLSSIGDGMFGSWFSLLDFNGCESVFPNNFYLDSVVGLDFWAFVRFEVANVVFCCVSA